MIRQLRAGRCLLNGNPVRATAMSDEVLQLRVHGEPGLPALVYLPGLHGDWTLAAGFRRALGGRVRFVEITYPRTLTWSMREYVEAIRTALIGRGLERGWLLAESWGSQPAWGLLNPAPPPFEVQGLILAGGFVKHPWPWGPRLLRRIGEHTPMSRYTRDMKFYARYAKLRHGSDAETRAAFDEFVARRTALDRQAMRARLELLDDYDPRPLARDCLVPVHYLAGMVDPLIPWVLVRRWLRRNCPGYRGGKTFWLADHNVLVSAPKRSAELILRWMREG